MLKIISKYNFYGACVLSIPPPPNEQNTTTTTFKQRAPVETQQPNIDSTRFRYRITPLNDLTQDINLVQLGPASFARYLGVNFG